MSWEDWDDEEAVANVLKTKKEEQSNGTLKPKWTEENFEGFKEEKTRLDKLADLHPHYAAQKDNMPHVIIKKREPGKAWEQSLGLQGSNQQSEQMSIQERERLYEEKRRQLFGPDLKK